ncbi:MAG: exodeoxyribonuclease VII large subunit [Gammaproteobacteria bacterium]|nr:exodeoxyribonuclease VII large subunit [Gammaproteobacteria bacterium]|tara:strand:+ start:68 stop:1291 length:1224 start_codon:yes stop_codon:yes gene_type:complete
MEDYSNQTTGDQREILSVSEVNKTADDFINEAFPPLWVAGEISNFVEYGTTGHWYFSIKDSNSVLSCTMFKFQNMNLGFKPKEGDQVILQGKLGIYQKAGRYQMKVSKMELAGFGELMRKYEQLKNKLSSEGLFNKKNPDHIPEIISRVAVVTSAHGAAIRDVISTLQRRSPHIEILVVPAKVQGDGSARSIQQSLERIDDFHKKNIIDAVILCRGGGSIEDLWSFNDEGLCRYLAEYDIPVISGVGHETDFTLTDFIANIRAATPTAAAEIVSEGSSKLHENFEFLKQSLTKEVKQKINQLSEKLATLQRLLRSPTQRLQEQYMRLDSNLIELKAKFNALFAEKINLLKVLKEKLNVINPEQILGRGYSITFTNDGKILSDAGQANEDDILETRLAKGTVKSKVTN